jgi:predicted ATPase/class 3 adenylate cyclase
MQRTGWSFSAAACLAASGVRKSRNSFPETFARSWSPKSACSCGRELGAVDRERSGVDSRTAIFLFTDIQGSTSRWERNRDAMAGAVRRHDEIIKASILGSRGRIFKTVGDAFCAAFSTVPDALGAAREAQRALANEDWSDVDGLDVRMAIHAGSVEERDGDYFGPPLNRVARLLAIGQGGQVLVSGVAAHLAAGDLPFGVQLSYLGQHRLRDIEGAESVYQLDASDLRAKFPALRSLEETPNNLPLQLTSFVGREQELVRLRQAIDTSRLISLVGTGGVGKSRLALQLSAELLDRFTDGVWLVDLSLVRESDAVAAEIASTIAVRASAAKTVTLSIAEYISDKRILLILDCCEHVPSAVGALADALLHACPNVTIVVTSRQALDIGGELVFTVETLELDAAIKLFVERASAASSRFSLTTQNETTVTDICRRLDGIPLALELAAPKIAVLSPNQLLQRLDERFRLLTHTGSNRLPRQQTLRALIDWSFDLLNEHERTLFRRTSIFAGGCTLQAAGNVCGDARIDDWQVFELMTSLASKSLVVVRPDGEDQRYRMLDTIRDYGREQLAAANEAEDIAGRHARYYADMTRDLYPLVEALEDVKWQQMLSPETDNLRALLDWTIFGGHDATVGMTALSYLESPELITTPQEAVRWFDAAIDLVHTLDDAFARARIWRHYLRLQWLTGRPNAQVEKATNAAIAAARASGDPSEIAHALSNLANTYRDTDRFEEAERWYEQAFEKPEVLTAITRNSILRNWAISSLQCGKLEVARQRFTDVARLERPGSEAHASALINLGELEFAVGNIDAARDTAKQAKKIFEELDAAPLALVLCNLAAYAMAADQLDEARDFLRDALDMLKKSGARWGITAIEHCALLAELLSDHERAAKLVGFTGAQYATQGTTRQQTEKYGYERLKRLLGSAYDAHELNLHMTEGARLTEEQALALAAAISTKNRS